MLMKVVVENGVKKLVPLTADAGSGNPCGTIIAIYSNQVPYGYLPCNGVQFDTAQFPVLYALLGDDHTPDLRECVLVGSGQSGRTVLDESGHNHDVYTVGQFKDDQLQNHTHYDPISIASSQDGYVMPYSSSNVTKGNNMNWVEEVSQGRAGTTTHGKQVGVNFCIKATSGINENQADNVLSALTPVNEVALGNLHSVTSNAVAQAFGVWQTVWRGDDNVSFIWGIETKFGKMLRIHFAGIIVQSTVSNGDIILTVTDNKWKPSTTTNRFGVACDGSSTRFNANIDYNLDGTMRIYFEDNTPMSGSLFVNGVYVDYLLLLV